VRYLGRDIREYIDAHRVIHEGGKKVTPTKPAPAVMQDIRAIPPHLRGMRGLR